VLFATSLSRLSPLSALGEPLQVERLTWASVKLVANDTAVFIGSVGTDLWDGDPPQETPFTMGPGRPPTYAYHRVAMRVQACDDDECLHGSWADVIAKSGTEEKTREAWLAANTPKADIIVLYFANR
jgi:hypothetical protein